MLDSHGYPKQGEKHLRLPLQNEIYPLGQKKISINNKTMDFSPTTLHLRTGRVGTAGKGKSGMGGGKMKAPKSGV